MTGETVFFVYGVCVTTSAGAVQTNGFVEKYKLAVPQAARYSLLASLVSITLRVIEHLVVVIFVLFEIHYI